MGLMDVEQDTQIMQKVADSDRRCIKRKETIAYCLYDASQGFNLNGQRETFVDSILGISLSFQSLYNMIGGAWDIVNDLLIGSLIEKTRTRWGKFRPYLFTMCMPIAICAAFYWALPAVFGDTAYNYLPKLIAYAALELIKETADTFKQISANGLLSTITPYPVERTRLISIKSYVSMFAGLPSTLVEILFDLLTNNVIKSAKYTSKQIGTFAYLFMGPTTVMLGGLVEMWFVTVSRERVPQTMHVPSVKESVKSVVYNKPVLMYIMSEALLSFGTGIGTNSYYKWVLFFGMMETVCGIPSAFVQPIGFAKAGKLKLKYSTKSLYMVSSCFAKSLYIPVFCYGMLKKKDGTRFFRNVVPMMPVTALWEIAFASFQGIKSVSSQEVRNECMDYCEWKNGFRSEATLTMAQTIFQKIPSRLNNIIQPFIKKWIGYDQSRYPQGIHQEPKTELWIFAMATLFPAVICLIGIIPMYFYNIDKHERERMYYELITQRAEKAEKFKQEHSGEFADGSGISE